MQSIGNDSSASGLDQFIGILVIGEPVRHRGLSVYPLKGRRHATAVHYLVLDDAIKSGGFRITEVSEGGSVPRLRAFNESATPVFLLDGEQLIGAKQNRVLNLSVMLAANSDTEIPVSCVEAGRWRTQSRDFLVAEEAYFAHGRAEKMEQVSRALHSIGEPRSDQGAVWGTIAAKSARMEVASPTSANSEIYASRQQEVRGYIDSIPVESGQVGAAYAIGDTLIGIELFDSDATFKKLAGKLAASYALDAIERDDTAAPPGIDAVRAFMQSVCSAQQQRSTTVGIGEAVRLSTDDIVGAALEVDGSCVHLAAFRRNAAEHAVRARHL